MARIFLSYKREERDRVRAIVSALEAMGHTVWWDPHLDPRDASYPIQIRREIENADACVVAWSKLAVESDFVVAEAEMARAQRKLVCVLLDHDCMPPPPFNTTQLIDLSDWQGSAGHPEWRRLMGAIDQPSGLRRATIARDRPKRSPREAVGAVLIALSSFALWGFIVVVAVGLLAGLYQWGHSALRQWRAENGPAVIFGADYEYAAIGEPERRARILQGPSSALTYCPNGEAARPLLRNASLRGRRQGACDAARADFPTAWEIFGVRRAGDERYPAYSIYASYIGRPLTSSDQQAQLRSGEEAIEAQHALTGSWYAVPEDYELPGTVIWPNFASERDDTVLFRCDLSVRQRAYNSSYELYGPPDLLESRTRFWSRGDVTGSHVEHLWVNFARGRWAATTETNTAPADIDGDGEIWEEIAAGSDSFVCLSYLGVGDMSTGGMTYACVNYLDLSRMERAYVTSPELRLSALNTEGYNPLINRAIYLHSRELIPGVATARLGACRQVAQ